MAVGLTVTGWSVAHPAAAVASDEADLTSMTMRGPGGTPAVARNRQATVT